MSCLTREKKLFFFACLTDAAGAALKSAAPASNKIGSGSGAALKVAAPAAPAPQHCSNADRFTPFVHLLYQVRKYGVYILYT